MYRVKIHITRREGIIQPEGDALLGALHKLNFTATKKVCSGKCITLNIEKVADIETYVKEMCESLLVNNVMEDYTYEIEEV